MAPPVPMSAGPATPSDPVADPSLPPAQASQSSIDASRIDVSATRKQFQQLAAAGAAAGAAQPASDAASARRRSASPNRSVGGARGSVSATQLPDGMSTTASLTSSVSTLALGNMSAMSLPGDASRTMLQGVDEAMRQPPMSPATRAGAPPSRSASAYGLAATPSRSTSLHALAVSAAPPMTPSRTASTSPYPRKPSASTVKPLPPLPPMPPVPHPATAHLGAYTSMPDLTHHPSPPSSNTSSACTTDSWPSTASLGSKSPIAVRRRRRSSVGTSVLTTTTSSVAAPAGGAGLAAASAPALPTSSAAAAAADATGRASSIRRSMSDHLPAAAPAAAPATGASEQGLHAVAGTADQDGPYILSRHAPDGVTILEQYIVGNCIGRGQFGAVFRAINVDSHHTVAIKRFELANNKDQETILTEVRKMETLDHPNVVKYIGFIQTETDFNIILEFVENGSLASTLKHFGPLPEKVVVAIVFKVLQGLTYIHQQGLKHLDLKAANILTTKDGNVKLSDFGVSQSVTDTKSDGVGTAYWMAPEIIYPGKSSTASDIWSLGCTIIELLTGEPPYYEFKNPWAALYRIVEDACPPLPDNISDDMRSFLLCCLQKDENARWTAAQLLQHPWIVHSVYNQRRRGTNTPGTPGFPKAPAPPPPPSPPVTTPMAPDFSMLPYTTTVAWPAAPYDWPPRPIASPVGGAPTDVPRQAMTDDSTSVHATEISSVGTLPPTTFLPDSTPMVTTARHGPTTSSPPAPPVPTVFPSPLQMAQLARSPHVPSAPTPVVGALVDRMRDVVSPGRAAARRRSGAAAAVAAAVAAAGFLVPTDAPPVPNAARNPHKWIKLALDACVECRICAQLVRKGRVCSTCSAIVCKACAACPPIGGRVVVCGSKPGATPPATTSPAPAVPPPVAALRSDDYAPMARRDKATARRAPPSPLAAMDAAFWSAIEQPPPSTTTGRTPATPSPLSAPPGPLAAAALAGGGVPRRKPAAARDDCVIM
ncbi:STE/STE11/CDC15 protein kinase [Allomyces macrogynus ATCC 38327]|uniref:STE/STE11/CDC15 protein kinase n=1 Tax=Allomyces macrogynus (strain ATCC 38327) TaxID=578462 RepID=A0A0L0SMU1_ALLM3|nr:STE/STE11/CDC15 protein kinase [Allomyces macrogynus ATCC 38327]|eukprot:KNE63700.1 STE/STE11/CDC15 protein kinase [Allomyces macrogynus ATCC 38327]